MCYMQPQFASHGICRTSIRQLYGTYALGTYAGRTMHTAYIYYEPHSEVVYPIYALKYNDHPEYGYEMGRLIAQEIKPTHFFDGIDAITAVPLAKNRQRHRGYNQCIEIANGIQSETNLPIIKKGIERIRFKSSQTTKTRWQRNENVQNIFRLKDSSAFHGKHILLIDDVMTTGATLVSCANEITKAENVKISILTIGLAVSPFSTVYPEEI